MTGATEIAKRQILEPSGLGDAELQATLDELMSHSLDVADLYFQSTRYESWVLEDGIVKDGSHNIEQGVGVRAVTGERTGFAYSDEVAVPALMQAAGAARAIAHSGGNARVQVWRDPIAHELYSPADPLESLAERERIELLERVDAEARRADPRVQQVIVTLAGEFSRVLVAASDGTLVGDVRPLVRLNVSVIVEEGERREQASSVAADVTTTATFSMGTADRFTPGTRCARRWSRWRRATHRLAT